MPSVPLIGILPLVVVGFSSDSSVNSSFKRLAIPILKALPKPILISSSSMVLLPVSLTTWLSFSMAISSSLVAPKAWLSKRLPSASDSVFSCERK